MHVSHSIARGLIVIHVVNFCFIVHVFDSMVLQAELADQIRWVAAVRAKLDSEKGRWLAHLPVRQGTVWQLLQHCAFPRSVLSPEDSLFTAKV